MQNNLKNNSTLMLTIQTLYVILHRKTIKIIINMEINEYFKKRDELQQQLRDLDKTFSEEHPFTQKFKGKIIKAYDYKAKCWSEPFKMRGVRLYGRETVVNGHAVLANDRIAEGLIRECFVHNENDIEVINN